MKYNKSEVELLRDRYPEGTRVELDCMKGESQMQKGLRGTITFIDDIGQIHVNWDNGSTLALHREEDLFKVIHKEELIRVLYIEPGKYPEIMEIPNTLVAKQELVGGMIESVMPFDDEVALVCNEESKLLRMPINRGLRDEDGILQDVICGSFLVCYAPIESVNFESLPNKLIQKYEELFHYPETLIHTNHGIMMIPYLKDNEIEL